jgi:hypothetical protein
MHYEDSVPFRGDTQKAMEFTRTLLASNNFVVDIPNRHTIHGKGMGMTSNKQDPLTGATDITVEFKSSEIVLSAFLGGLRTMTNFIYYFPWGLLLYLAITFIIIGDFKLGSIWILVGCGLPWLFLSPLIAKSMKKRVTYALKAFITNIKSAGEM